MNTKHTPGPWTHKDSHEETSAIFAGEDRDLIADARTVADARLIAAAPELLAALRGLLSETPGTHESASVRAARAAIARAEGT